MGAEDKLQWAVRDGGGRKQGQEASMSLGTVPSMKRLWFEGRVQRRKHVGELSGTRTRVNTKKKMLQRKELGESRGNHLE